MQDTMPSSTEPRGEIVSGERFGQPFADTSINTVEHDRRVRR